MVNLGCDSSVVGLVIPSGYSEARALTNLIGNGVATIIVAKWEGVLDERRLQRHLNVETEAEAEAPESVLIAEELGRGGA